MYSLFIIKGSVDKVKRFYAAKRIFPGFFRIFPAFFDFPPVFRKGARFFGVSSARQDKESGRPRYGSYSLSLGMRQSPRGDSATEPTLTPSGMAERLNCWVAKRL